MIGSWYRIYECQWKRVVAFTLQRSTKSRQRAATAATVLSVVIIANHLLASQCVWGIVSQCFLYERIARARLYITLPIMSSVFVRTTVKVLQRLMFSWSSAVMLVLGIGLEMTLDQWRRQESEVGGGQSWGELSCKLFLSQAIALMVFLYLLIELLENYA